MPSGTELAQALQRVFEPAGVPPSVLADVWREALAAPTESTAFLADDIRAIWERPPVDLQEIAAPGEDVPLAARGGLVAMVWAAQFVLLARRASPLRGDIQQTTASFFEQAVNGILPPGTRQVTRLRIYINAKREPAFGGLVIRQEGVFYAVCGPQPGTAELAVTRCTTWTAAVSTVMRFLTATSRLYQNLTPAGTVDYASYCAGCQSWPETCDRCQSPVGPSGVCYHCAQLPAPEIVDPAEEQRVRESARDTIFAALRRYGVTTGAASRIWRGTPAAALGEASPNLLPDARRLLALLGLPETLLRGLSPRELAACARLQLLASTGRDSVRELAQRCYQHIVMEDLAGARRWAEQHDRLAQLLGDVTTLVPLVTAYAAGTVPEEARRPLAQLVSAKTGNPRAAELLARYVSPQSDVPVQLAALKALQWLAETSPQALPPLTEALRSSVSTVRLVGTQALALAAAWGRVPPAVLLGQLAQSDWNPLVRQGATTALVLGGVPPCPVCGQPLVAGAAHECLAAVGTWDTWLPLYEQTLLGLRPAHGGRVLRLMQAFVAAEAPTSPWAVDVIAQLLQQETIAPSTRIHALAALAALVEGAAPALFPLLRSPNWAVSALATAALLRSGVPLAAHPDLVPGVQAQAATMARHGQLHLAALALPPTAEGDWEREYPALASFFLSVYHCPACGVLCTAPGHHCAAPLETQLEALAGIEQLLADAQVAGHPLASLSLLTQYNALAATLRLPPHPLGPLLPSPSIPVPPDARTLLADQDPERRSRAARSLAQAGSLRALLSLAVALHGADAEDGVRAAVLQSLGELGLGLCPDCGRLVPQVWKHRCRSTRTMGIETLPASWQAMQPELSAALGLLADEPVGQLFAYVIQQDEELNHLGVAFSRLHALLSDDPATIPPAAMLAQVGARWFTLTGPSADEQLVVEEQADRLAAYRVAQAFLRQEAARLATAESGLQLASEVAPPATSPQE